VSGFPKSLVELLAELRITVETCLHQKWRKTFKLLRQNLTKMKKPDLECCLEYVSVSLNYSTC